MRIGDIVHTAIWIDGRETPEVRAQYEQDVRESLVHLCDAHGFEIGLVTFTEKHPEDNDVPPVPDHINGERIRLLYAEADVVSKKVLSSKGSFIADLDKKDLELLRSITRKAGAAFLTDAQCDEIIEEIGPEAAMDAVRKNYIKTLH